MKDKSGVHYRSVCSWFHVASSPSSWSKIVAGKFFNQLLQYIQYVLTWRGKENEKKGQTKNFCSDARSEQTLVGTFSEAPKTYIIMDIQPLEMYVEWNILKEMFWFWCMQSCWGSESIPHFHTSLFFLTSIFNILFWYRFLFLFSRFS